MCDPSPLWLVLSVPPRHCKHSLLRQWDQAAFALFIYLFVCVCVCLYMHRATAGEAGIWACTCVGIINVDAAVPK